MLRGSARQWFADDTDSWSMEGWPTSPQALYDSVGNVVWASWASVNGSTAGSTRQITTKLYDRSAKSWGPEHIVATNLNVDEHGSPGKTMDQYGRVNYLFGGHASNIKYSYTTNPRDPTSFTAAADIAGVFTYYQPVTVGAGLYLFSTSTGQGNQDICVLEGIPASTGGVPSWTNHGNLTNFGAFASWMGNATVSGTKIGFPFTYTSDTYQNDVYYGWWDTVTKAFSNIDGSFSVASGSLPISRATAQAHFQAFGSPSTLYSTTIPVQVVDGAGTTHVIFSNGLYTGSDEFGSFALQESHWTGSAWSASVGFAGSTQSNSFANVAACPSSDGGFDVYWSYTTNQLEDAWTIHWSPLSGFGTATKLLTATMYDIPLFQPVWNGPPDASLLVGEANNYFTYQNPTPISNPQPKLYLYGSNGFVT